MVAHVRARSVGRPLEPTTFSIGVATLDPRRATYGDIDTLVQAADAALYHAKEEGRNRVRAT
jgi:PleD family two-component response regulator